MPTKILTDGNFQKEVIDSDTLVLVDFWATWCNSCKQLSPIIEELSKDYDKKDIKIYKLDVGENPDFASRLAVLSLPTILLFKNGKVVEQITGSVSKNKLNESIKKLIKK